MQSPFPGMDPYLQSQWRDVHASLVVYARDEIQNNLPAGLRARAEERVVLEAEDGAGLGFYPDVRVIEQSRNGGGTAVMSADVRAEPLIIRLDSETATEAFLEIIDVSSGHRVVTVIEFLSMSNKATQTGRKQYQQKQRELQKAQVSLVEIDLLRGGRHITNIPKGRIPKSHRTACHICVKRGWEPNAVEFYRAPIQKPLPRIGIPLRKNDADVSMNLQSLIDQCYRNGRYDDIDYTQPPEPPLDAADAEWADALLRQKGLRK